SSECFISNSSLAVVSLCQRVDGGFSCDLDVNTLKKVYYQFGRSQLVFDGIYHEEEKFSM
ncbi:hypothetical protein, partial [Porphyromonas crevioricanis]|uniref:hypothetical protein n=1 Tax=Porphyromonas crevioricanis TaxID=393921 RepID=UPI001F1F5FDF